MIQNREAIAPGIAGPFLNGANWSVAPEEWAQFGGDIDMKSWFIETLRVSSVEPKVPHIQTLEFYAHELFAFDVDAVREFWKMGRCDLAVMTATEEPMQSLKCYPYSGRWPHRAIQPCRQQFASISRQSFITLDCTTCTNPNQIPRSRTVEAVRATHNPAFGIEVPG